MRALATLAVLALAAAAPTAVAAAATERTLNFEVQLGERAIGRQSFELRGVGAELTVETQAEFVVRVLGIAAFTYRHRNAERWQSGCLEAIDAETDSNGRPYRVLGRRGPDGFRVDASTGQMRLQGCVGSFAYWDRELLVARERLLNSQTGEYVPVAVRAAGKGTLRIGEREIPVEHYAISGADLDITVSYATAGGEWLALDSRLEGDRVLRYRRDPADFD
jgi:hypothetical protein